MSHAFWYYVSVYVHLLSAVFWIGGMLFTVAVLVPASRHKALAQKRGTLFRLIGEKFSRISWILFIVLLVTGVTNLLGRGFTFQQLFTSSFWQGSMGYWLRPKLYLFGAVLVLSGIHDFYAGPKAARLMDNKPEDRKTRKFRIISSWVGRINFLLGLLILYYAMRLTRL